VRYEDVEIGAKLIRSETVVRYEYFASYSKAVRSTGTIHCLVQV
jgi:hypothetical protein